MQRETPKQYSLAPQELKLPLVLLGQAVSMDGARGTPAESEVKERKSQAEDLWLFTGGLCRNAETR